MTTEEMLKFEEMQAVIGRLRAALRGLLDEVMCFAVDPPSAALNHAMEEASDALGAQAMTSHPDEPLSKDIIERLHTLDRRSDALEAADVIERLRANETAFRVLALEEFERLRMIAVLLEALVAEPLPPTEIGWLASGLRHALAPKP